MNTITHIHFSHYFLPQMKAVALGAIFPDTHIFLPLSYSQTHQNNISLIDFTKKTNPVLLPFAQSALLHEKLDYLGDQNWQGTGIGYCFLKGKEIIKEVKDAFETEDEIYALFKAHTFIEMAIQLLLVQTHRYLTERFINALSDKQLIREISKLLSKYYSLEPEIFEDGFAKIPSIVEYENPNLETMLEKFNVRNRVKNNRQVDLERGKLLLKKAIEIIKRDCSAKSIDRLSIFEVCRDTVKRQGLI